MTTANSRATLQKATRNTQKSRPVRGREKGGRRPFAVASGAALRGLSLASQSVRHLVSLILFRRLLNFVCLCIIHSISDQNHAAAYITDKPITAEIRPAAVNFN